jgi:hypothetical protein
VPEFAGYDVPETQNPEEVEKMIPLDLILKYAEKYKIPAWQAEEEMLEGREVSEEWAKRQTVGKDSLGMLGMVEPGTMLAVSEGEWEELVMNVDSGASETVITEEAVQFLPLEEGEAKKRGVKYEVADGTLIPNLGERNFVAVAEQGQKRRMKPQVSEVNKNLLSVRRATAAGNRVVFEEDYGYIEDKATGEKLWMKQNEGMYTLSLWVRRASGF